MENILQKINTAGLRLLEAMTPDDTYSAIVNEAMRLVDAEYGSIILIKNDEFVRVYASEPFFYKLNPKKNEDMQRVLRENKLVVRNITITAPVDPLIKQMKIQSRILIPLSYRNESIGILSVHSLRKEHFSEREVDMLRVFGSMATLAIKKAQQYNETKKALEIRDMFISMAAHELRTPLTSISGYIQLLYSRLAKTDGVEANWIRELYEENKRMMHLVKELLEVNRLRAGQVQFMWQECNLIEILRQAMQDVMNRFNGRTINCKIALKADSIVIGDKDRLIKVFDNLIDNACKYSPKDTKVELSLAEKGNFYIITIKDNGKGIHENDLPNIFSGQHQGEGGEEGMGIGLLFVENIIRQHRGAIDVKSKVKKGTTIEVKLPKAKYGK